MKVAFDRDAAKAANNLSKHGIAFEEAMSVFSDPLLASTPDPDHGPSEERWITIGEVAPGRLLLVVHTWAEQDIENVFVPDHFGPSSNAE